jgi:hypothetical protein
MKQIIIISIGAFAFSNQVRAQGCSDAGFCSIGSLDHQTNEKQKPRAGSLKLGLPVGQGDEGVFVFTPALEYSRNFGNWTGQAKLTANYASGNLGSALGLGDAYLSGTYTIPTQKKWSTSFTLGVKLPLNQGNLREKGLSLPMQYQSSLGTVDLIAGIALSSEKWKWAAGWQQPLSGRNRNQFLPVYWNTKEAMAYPPSNDFNRKGDVLLRTSYRLLNKKKTALEAGLLGIYHLANDTYVNASISNNPIAISGSQGLTLNATASFEWSAGKNWRLGLIGGVPLVVRDVRPDGLTRRFVLAPQISYEF